MVPERSVAGYSGRWRGGGGVGLGGRIFRGGLADLGQAVAESTVVKLTFGT